MRETTDHLPGFLPLDRTEHSIRNVPFLGFLRRELKMDAVVVYWHTVTHNWVVAIKTTRGGQTGIWEMMVLNHDPEGKTPLLGPETVHALKLMWFTPADPREISRGLKSDQAAFIDKKIAQDEAALSVDQWAARRMRQPMRDKLAWAARAMRQKRVYA